MFQNLDVFQSSIAMARHAGARQAVTATNMANADTPGYRAQTIAPFAQSVADGATQTQRMTRDGHLAARTNGSGARIEIARTEASPNGNSVSLENEMVNAIEIQREHNRALTVYKHSMDVLRMTIGRK